MKKCISIVLAALTLFTVCSTAASALDLPQAGVVAQEDTAVISGKFAKWLSDSNAEEKYDALSQKKKDAFEAKYNALTDEMKAEAANLSQKFLTGQITMPDYTAALDKATKDMIAAQIKLLCTTLHIAAPKDLASDAGAPNWTTIAYGWRVVLMIVAFGWAWMR